MEHRLGDRVEGPGPDDLVALGANVRREELGVALGVELPMRTNLGRQRAGEPGVEDVFLAEETARLSALRLVEAAGHVRGRIDRQPVRCRQNRVFMVGLAVCIERIPHWNRHTEKALTTHAPVEREIVGPVAVADPHELRVPFHFGALGQECVLLVEQTNEPLPRWNQLERSVALLVELDRVFDRLGLTLEGRAVAGRAPVSVAQQLDDGRACLGHILAGEPGVVAVGRVGIGAREGFASEAHLCKAPIAADQLSQHQALGPPPLQVRLVAERTHHQDARPLLGVGQFTGEDRHRHAEERRHGVLSKEIAVALVVGVRGHTHTGGQQFRPRRRDHEAAVAVLDAKLDVVEGAGRHAVDRFGLRHRGLEVHVPHGRCVGVVEMALLREIEKRELGELPRPLADRLVGLRPVNREPHSAEHSLEGLLVLGGHALAELDEVGARNQTHRLLAPLRAGRLNLESLFVRLLRIATNVEEILDTALGGQPVVVPTDGIEDVHPGHPLLADHHISVGVGEDVADVERARDGRGRRIDHEGLRPWAIGIPAIGPVLVPETVPAQLGRWGVEVLGQRAGIEGLVTGHLRARSLTDREHDESRKKEGRTGALLPVSTSPPAGENPDPEPRPYNFDREGGDLRRRSHRDTVRRPESGEGGSHGQGQSDQS